MQQIRVNYKGEQKTISVETGSMLMASLREQGYEIWAPCGGSGTCGKCKVNIKDEGSVTSCLYPVDRNFEVFLPDNSEAKVLLAQHNYTVSLPLNPGDAASLSYYPFGVAIDIGTTTLAFYLINLVSGTLMETRSRMNPQAKYGGDVVSRIEYCNKTDGGLQVLQKEILTVIDEELEHFIHVSGISKNEIVKINVAANTTMLHLLAGVDPISLALAPYKPVFTDRKTVKGSELLKNCHADSAITLLPSVSAYVGADIVAGLASISPKDEIKNYLFVDIGTNGEMALVANGKVYCCSTAAGPAFEGANISCGMGAFSGAIASYQDKKIKTVGNESAKGICGSGLIDVIASLLNDELISMEGNLEENFYLTDDVSISPQDIREVQLAKSAILSGMKILINDAELTFDGLDALFLAGGFGNYINIDNAMRIGLLPIEMKGKVIPIGNASGTGATLSCTSQNFDKIMDDMLVKTEYIELATHEEFAMEYAMNMYFM